MNIVQVRGREYVHFVFAAPIKWLLFRGQIVGGRQGRFFKDPFLLVLRPGGDNRHVNIFILDFITKGIGPFGPWTILVLFGNVLFEHLSSLNGGCYPNAVSKV
jgi:hypothetical protein